jgi:UTP--glucose-1-phosphate uridylyltransferase
MPRSTITRPTKAVFPLADLGGRLRRPGAAYSAMAGRIEMLNIVDKPLIQYAIEETLAAGFSELIFVTGPARRTNGADRVAELEAALELRGRTELLESIRDFVPRSVNCVLVRQPEPLGAAHAVLCARPIVGEEPFAVVLADELLDARRPPHAGTLDGMATQYESYRCSIVGARRLDEREEAPNGVLRCAAQFDSLYQVAHVADAPRFHDGRFAQARFTHARSSDAYTEMAVVGRYIFAPSVMKQLETLTHRSEGAGAGIADRADEARLLDGIAMLLRHETVLAHEIECERYDCGSRLGYLKAMLAFGLAHPEVGPQLARHVADLARELDPEPDAGADAHAGAATTDITGTMPCAESSELSPSAT